MNQARQGGLRIDTLQQPIVRATMLPFRRGTEVYRRRTRQAGLTLIELLVALLLTALIATLSWRGLDALARSSTQVLSQTEQTQRIHQTLTQLEVDLMEAAQLRRNGLFALMRSEISAQEAGSIVFRRAIPESPTLAPLRWVRWQVRGGSLQRVLSAELLSPDALANLGSAAANSAAPAQGVHVQVLLEGVRAMQLRPIVPLTENEVLDRPERWSGLEVVLVQSDGRRLRRVLSLRD